MKEEIGLHTSVILGLIVFMFIVGGIVPSTTKTDDKGSDQFNTQQFFNQTEEYNPMDELDAE